MQCEICGTNVSDNQNTIYHVREMMFGTKQVFEYFQCPNCECLQMLTLPVNTKAFYPNNYYSFKFHSVGSLKNWAQIQRNRWALFGTGALGHVYDYIKPHFALRALSLLNPEVDSKILDVGCGEGSLLMELAELGFENLTGVDPYCEQSVQYSNGVKVFKTTLDKIEGKYDIIMFHHSFEHFLNPQYMLQGARNILTPSGRIIIRIPTVSSWAWKYYGTNWVQLDAPRHIFLHSVKSMNILAQNAELHISRIVYDSNEIQFLGSELYCKEHSLTNAKFSLVKQLFFRMKAEKLNNKNQGDQAIFLMEP